MKSILLIGLGRFGRHIAKKLNSLNHEVMAIDYNEERLQDVLPYVTNAQIGDSTNEEFLRSLGVRNYDACIVAIGDDFQSSLETASLLKELGAKLVIARASSDVQEKFLLRNGADEVVYPEKQLANWTAIRCTSNHVLDYIQLDESYSIFEIDVPTAWANKSIAKSGARQRFNINILAIRENGKLNMDIDPGTILYAHQSILVLGHQKAIQQCFHI